ncbi:MAG: PRD domain-containing protein [Eubacteriaceae bacterium]|jgi:mannitol operon transcriptional antiterminator|nr:PRD domain-containing protein [Eubacteriaceae bacterium]
MELNGRMINIIQEILDSDETKQAHEIYSKLGFSKRTFYYEVERIKSWMDEEQLGSLELENGVCSIICENRDNVREVIESSNTQYYMSADERKILMVFYIGLGLGKVRIGDFCRLFDITKNTVLADFRIIKEDLSRNGIQLTSQQKRGYFLIGSEFEIRRYLRKQYEKLLVSKTKQIVLNFLDGEIGSLLGKEMHYCSIFKESMLIYEENVKTNLIDIDAKKVALIIAISYLRNMKGYAFITSEENKEKIENENAFVGVKQLFDRLGQFSGVHLPDGELDYITINILGLQNFDLYRIVANDSESAAVSKIFIENVETISGVKINKKEKLFDRLVLHMESMIYRIRYDNQLENPMADTIKNMYSDAFNLAAEGLAVTDSELANKITDDELAFLAVYIASEIKPEIKHKEQKSEQKILIICGEGVATAIMVRNQLEEMLGDYYEYKLSSAKNILEQDFNEYLLILTTVKSELLKDYLEKGKAIRVNPLIEEHDKQKIIEQLDCFEKGSYCFSIREVMKIIREYTGDKQYLLDLNVDLLNYFHDHNV